MEEKMDEMKQQVELTMDKNIEKRRRERETYKERKRLMQAWIEYLVSELEKALQKLKNP